MMNLRLDKFAYKTNIRTYSKKITSQKKMYLTNCERGPASQMTFGNAVHLSMVLLTNLAGHNQTQQFRHLKPVNDYKPKAIVQKNKKQVQSNIRK